MIRHEFPRYADAHDRGWLTEDEQRAWRTYLRMSSLLPAALNRQLQPDCGLTLPEYEVLVQLSEAPEHRRRPFQVCEALNWEQSRLSHQLTRMERRGLVTREECAADGAGRLRRAHPGRRRRHRQAAPLHVATVRELVFDRLSEPQRATFEQACAAIIDALGRVRGRTCCRGDRPGRCWPGRHRPGRYCPSRNGRSRGRSDRCPRSLSSLVFPSGAHGRLVLGCCRRSCPGERRSFTYGNAFLVHREPVVGADQLGELMPQR